MKDGRLGTSGPFALTGGLRKWRAEHGLKAECAARCRPRHMEPLGDGKEVSVRLQSPHALQTDGYHSALACLRRECRVLQAASMRGENRERARDPNAGETLHIVAGIDSTPAALALHSYNDDHCALKGSAAHASNQPAGQGILVGGSFVLRG